MIEAATLLFVRQGYVETSMVDVARESGVARDTLFRHFGDKETLLCNVLIALSSAGVVVTPEVRRTDSLFDILRRTAVAMQDFALMPCSIDLVRLMVGESRRFPTMTRKVAIASFVRFRRKLVYLFQALARCRLIEGGDHKKLAESYIDVVLGMSLVMACAARDGVPPDRTDLDDRIALFIRGAFGTSAAQPARNAIGEKGSALATRRYKVRQRAGLCQ